MEILPYTLSANFERIAAKDHLNLSISLFQHSTKCGDALSTIAGDEKQIHTNTK